MKIQNPKSGVTIHFHNLLLLETSGYLLSSNFSEMKVLPQMEVMSYVRYRNITLFYLFFKFMLWGERERDKESMSRRKDRRRGRDREEQTLH